MKSFIKLLLVFIAAVLASALYFYIEKKNEPRIYTKNLIIDGKTYEERRQEMGNLTGEEAVKRWREARNKGVPRNAEEREEFRKKTGWQL